MSLKKVPFLLALSLFCPQLFAGSVACCFPPGTIFYSVPLVCPPCNYASPVPFTPDPGTFPAAPSPSHPVVAPPVVYGNRGITLPGGSLSPGSYKMSCYETVTGRNESGEEVTNKVVFGGAAGYCDGLKTSCTSALLPNAQARRLAHQNGGFPPSENPHGATITNAHCDFAAGTL